jgi:hypothetical protein
MLLFFVHVFQMLPFFVHVFQMLLFFVHVFQMLLFFVRRGRDPMIVGFTTTYTIGGYHH